MVGHLKVQPCAGHRQAGLVQGLHRQGSSMCISFQMVQDLCHAFGAYLRILRLLFSEPSGVENHGTGGRLNEPSSVQLLLRLAGSQKMPFSVAPHLYPGMIIVTVGPERRVDLPGGNAHAAQSRHPKSGLLPAAAHGDPEHGPGVLGPPVRGSIGGLPGAPEINFYSAVIHSSALCQQRIFSQRACDLFMKKSPYIRDILIVHSIMKHIVGKDPLRPAGKNSLIPQINPMSGIGQKQTRGIIQKIAKGHGAVKEGKSLSLVPAAVLQYFQNLPFPIFKQSCRQPAGQLLFLTLRLPHGLNPLIQQGHLPIEGGLDLGIIFRRKHNILPKKGRIREEDSSRKIFSLYFCISS